MCPIRLEGRLDARDNVRVFKAGPGLSVGPSGRLLDTGHVVRTRPGKGLGVASEPSRAPLGRTPIEKPGVDGGLELRVLGGREAARPSRGHSRERSTKGRMPPLR